ncbi:hypothetical protein GCM10023084_01590 [Streptomyces lacrimifluminis]|uniref:Uncharacterized protein n=1 Tax=Streptomyces lacrimifluminis TaxID=1500077 RepID=A0A917KMR0_9ACTN|nr:hypothetical protein [Streptomyces lacrimifluminis]GGJ20952.1 hypothetical protein GCM10012282_16670 [Streptomyces lacrimifluminis]
MSRAIAVITSAAAKRLQTLGPVAQQAVEELRRELEDNPKLGIRRGSVRGNGNTAVYRTRLEPREDVTGLTIVYAYAPQPHPPAVAASRSPLMT